MSFAGGTLKEQLDAYKVHIGIDMCSTPDRNGPGIQGIGYQMMSELNSDTDTTRNMTNTGTNFDMRNVMTAKVSP